MLSSVKHLVALQLRYKLEAVLLKLMLLLQEPQSVTGMFGTVPQAAAYSTLHDVVVLEVLRCDLV